MRPYALALVLAAGAALPAVAFGSNGADDPPGGDRTATQSTAATHSTATTTSPAPAKRLSRELTAAQRSRAISVAQAEVGTPTTVVRVKRKRGGGRVGFDVRLRDETFRYRVRLDRDFGVLRVQRERLRAVAAGGDDDGTADQGRGDAPGTASGDDDGTADQGRGDDRGSDDGSGRGGSGGHGSDD